MHKISSKICFHLLNLEMGGIIRAEDTVRQEESELLQVCTYLLIYEFKL